MWRLILGGMFLRDEFDAFDYFTYITDGMSLKSLSPVRKGMF